LFVGAKDTFSEYALPAEDEAIFLKGIRKIKSIY
jgi:hypothetical protein